LQLVAEAQVAQEEVQTLLLQVFVVLRKYPALQVVQVPTPAQVRQLASH
jgi:hypothetical protein